VIHLLKIAVAELLVLLMTPGMGFG